MIGVDTKQKQNNTFLRWTGSKKWLIKDIDKYLPCEFNDYHEPFLGGGAVFFYIESISDQNRNYYLTDINEELINAYSQIKNNLNGLIATLKKYKNTSDFYYKIRLYKPRTPVNRAARFIYLNRTSFNGIYRVNSKGLYNVPYGRRVNVDIVTSNLFFKINKALENVLLQANTFINLIDNINAGDFVFLDPPYTVSHENNGFIEYNQKLFSWDDQIALKNFIVRLIEKEAYFLLTNASHSSIEELYRGIPGIKIMKVSRHCKIGGRNHTRKEYNELLIYNTEE